MRSAEAQSLARELPAGLAGRVRAAVSQGQTGPMAVEREGSGRGLRGAVRWEGTQRCRPAVGAPAVASWVTAVPPESPEPQLCPGPGDLRNIQSPTKARGTGEGVSLRHIPRLRARFHGNQSLLLAPSLPPGMAVGAVGHGTLWQGTSLRSPRAAQRQGQGLGATASAPGNTGKSSCAVGVLMCVSTWGAPLCLCVLSHVHVCVCRGRVCPAPLLALCWVLRLLQHPGTPHSWCSSSRAPKPRAFLSCPVASCSRGCHSLVPVLREEETPPEHQPFSYARSKERFWELCPLPVLENTMGAADGSPRAKGLDLIVPGYY